MANQTTQSETATVTTDTTETEAPQAVGLRDLLKNRNFRFLWLGQIISDFGDSLTILALLFLVNKLTGSAAALGTMLVVLAIPQLVFGLLAGVYVDRLDRKRIMIISDLLRGLLVLGFVVVGTKDMLWLLYVIAFMQASIGTFFNPARGALLPALVPQAGLLAANSISQTSRVIFGLLGTVAAGVLVGTLNIFWPSFAIDALTFFVSVLLVSRIKVPATEIAPKPEAGSGNVKAIFGQLADGMKIIVRVPALMGSLVAAAVLMLGIGAVNVLMVPLIINDLHVTATWFGAIEFAQTAAMVLSGSLVAVLANRFKPANIISICLVFIGVVIALISQVGSIWHLFPILFAVGLAVTPLQASFSTLVQTSVSSNLRGRIGATLNTLISTSSLVSMGAAGLVAEAIGVRNVFIVGGAVAVLAGLASAWVFRLSAKSEPVETEVMPTQAMMAES